jgi:DNA-binding response OmpR family regulator
MKILLIEDDPVDAEAIINTFAHDHQLSRVGSGEDAVRFLRCHAVDLVILDWHLPRMSGFDVLQWIRNTLGDEPAVLFLTNRMFEIDIVRALDAGADEYVVKPTRPSELAARINALARRIEKSRKVPQVLSVGDYVLNLTSRSIALRDRTIRLTVKEFTLIACFLENVGKVISRQSLASLGWGPGLDSSSRTIDTHVYRLRQKLALRPENGVRLTAIYTLGYRLDELAARVDSGDRGDSNAEKESAMISV